MRILPIVLASLVLAACGGGSGSADPDRPPKDVFAGSCGSCHTLAAAGTKGTFGPNLDELAPDEAAVLKAIEEGPGGMPGGLLEGAAAQKVAAYVADSAG